MISDLIDTTKLEQLLKVKVLKQHPKLIENITILKPTTKKKKLTQEQLDQRAERDFQWNQDNDYEVLADMEGSPANEFYYED